MRERVAKLLSVLFITSSLLVALFPFFVVKGESNTYINIPINECYRVYQGNNNYWLDVFVSGSDVRVTGYRNGNYVYVYFVSSSSFTLKFEWFNYSSCHVSNTTMNSTSSSGYHYISLNQSAGVKDSNIPFPMTTNNITNAIYYTFGEGAIGPEPEINYGDIIINGYSTDIAGSGSAAIQNIDHIKWNPDFDSNGNDISNMKIRLKIVPGNYIASRASDLLLQKYDDFIENQFNSDETVYNASDGEATISWEYIVNKFDNIINRIYLFNMGLNADTWEKQGWLYKLRLEDDDNEYIGDWQTVYSSTSSGVENDLNIVNNNSITQEFITTLQEINSINNVENNWTVNNTDISVTNNYTESSSGDKPWWAYLLESILNTFNITNNYIYEGDSNTQNITNTVNDSDDDMNRKIGEYQQFEDTFIDDMDSNLTDIDTDIDFLSDNKFIASANWVAQQYNRITNNTVIGSFIGFSLLFGLALIFIGKIHR